MKIKSDLFSGLGTAIFGIPAGMAYAKLAGVNPVYGLYSGMIATIIASFTTSSVLMISTLTSAIAISTHSVLGLAEIESHHLPQALFTLTFLVGVIMCILGLFKLGKIVDFISNAVMTGFVVGVSLLIMIGELNDLVGITTQNSNKIDIIIHWITQMPFWHRDTAIVGFGSILLMLFFQMIPKMKAISSLLVLMTFTLAVNLNHWKSVSLIGDHAAIPGHLPSMVFPDIHLIPGLVLGAISIALIALAQGAGVSNAIHNPDGSEPSHSRDFIGEGLGNIVGSFFQSMATGGSLSRTGISLGTGAKSRYAGVFTGLFTMLIFVFLTHAIEKIPMASISGILCVIAGNIIVKKYADIHLILTTSPASSFIMISTFLSTLFIPLQWAIFLGALLSVLFFLYTSSTKVRLVQWIQNQEGYFIQEKAPMHLSSHELMILDYEGNSFFGEIPAIKHLMPSIENVHSSVIIWRMRGCEDIHSTFLKWLKQFVDQFQANGNLFILEGVEAHAMRQLKKSGLIDSIGQENVFLAQPGIFMTLNSVIPIAKKWIAEHE